MTADAKVGLLLGLIFLVMIAFLINGLPNFLQTANADDAAVDVSITLPPSQELVIDERVIDKARDFQRNDIPLRQTTPPQEEIVLDASAQTQRVEPQPTVVSPTRASVHQPAAPKKAVAAGARTHVVASGENLAVIAQKYYGKEQGNRHVVIQKLFQANQSTLKSPDKVCVGQKLKIPPFSVLMAESSKSVAAAQLSSQPKATSSKTDDKSFLKRVSNLFERSDRESSVSVHVVQDGESLWGIAEETLGDGSRYPEILKLNKAIKDADDVVVGTHLKIPNP